jgi:hypothetical protein
MQNIKSAAELKYAIQLLEEEQVIKGKLLKEQFFITYESFKPISLLKSTLNEFSSSPYLLDNLLGSAMGVASGFLTKKIFVGSSGGLIRKLLGSILQFGVTNVVAQNSDTIRSIGQFIFQKIARKKDKNSDEQ